MIEAFGVEFGTIFQGGTLVALVALLGLLVRRDIALRQLGSTEAGDLRDHYAEEVKRYVAELERVLKRQLDCEGREEVLRGRVRTLEEEIAGLKRSIAQYSAETMAELSRIGCPRVKTPHAAAAAERVQKITGEGK